MCRWLAYSGAPILLKEALYGGTHSLVDQSLHSRLGAETTNGDGFGVGWYGAPATPGVFHSTEPAWNDSNLRELAGHVSSPLFFQLPHHMSAELMVTVETANRDSPRPPARCQRRRRPARRAAGARRASGS